MKVTLGELWTKDFAKGKLDKLIAISNLILDGCPDETISDKEYTYTYKGLDFDYDPDSSSIAWAYYKTMYIGKIPIKVKEDKNINSKGLPARIQGLFNYTEESIEQVTYGDLKLDKIALAGDCVFNFNQGKLANFVNLLKENTNLELLEKLKLCARMHHSPYNFSLMPVTGGMNNQKRSLSGYDRPDVLLYAISKFYENGKINLEELREPDIQEKIKDEKKMHEIRDKLWELQDELRIIQHREITDLYAYHFLATIGSFENYVRIFYHLDDNNPIDRSLVKEMLALGKESFDDKKNKKKMSVDALNAYMDLAITYWKAQRSKYE